MREVRGCAFSDLCRGRQLIEFLRLDPLRRLITSQLRTVLRKIGGISLESLIVDIPVIRLRQVLIEVLQGLRRPAADSAPARGAGFQYALRALLLLKLVARRGFGLGEGRWYEGARSCRNRGETSGTKCAVLQSGRQSANGCLSGFEEGSLVLLFLLVHLFLELERLFRRLFLFTGRRLSGIRAERRVRNSADR